MEVSQLLAQVEEQHSQALESLKKSLREEKLKHRRIVDRAKEMVEESKAEFERQSRELRAECEAKVQQDRLATSGTHRQQLRKLAESHRGIVGKLEAQLTEMRARLEAERAARAKHIIGVRKACEIHIGEVTDELEGKLKLARAENTQARDQITRLHASLEERTGALTASQAQLDQVNGQLRAALADGKRKDQEHAARLASALQEREVQWERRAEQAASDVKTARAEAQTHAQQKAEVIRRYQRKMRTIEQSLSQFRSGYAAREARYSRLRHQYIGAQAALKQVTGKLRDARRALAQAEDETKLRVEQSALALESAHTARLQELTVAHNSAVERMQKEHAQKLEGVHRLVNDEVMQARTQHLHQQITDARDKCKAAEAEAEASREKARDLQRDLESARAQQAKMAHECRQLTSRLEQSVLSQRALLELRDKYERVVATQGETQQEAAAAKERVRELSGLLSRLKQGGVKSLQKVREWEQKYHEADRALRQAQHENHYVFGGQTEQTSSQLCVLYEACLSGDSDAVHDAWASVQSELASDKAGLHCTDCGVSYLQGGCTHILSSVRESIAHNLAKEGSQRSNGDPPKHRFFVSHVVYGLVGRLVAQSAYLSRALFHSNSMLPALRGSLRQIRSQCQRWAQDSTPASFLRHVVAEFTHTLSEDPEDTETRLVSSLPTHDAMDGLGTQLGRRLAAMAHTRMQPLEAQLVSRGAELAKMEVTAARDKALIDRLRTALEDAQKLVVSQANLRQEAEEKNVSLAKEIAQVRSSAQRERERVLSRAVERQAETSVDGALNTPRLNMLTGSWAPQRAPVPPQPPAHTAQTHTEQQSAPHSERPDDSGRPSTHIPDPHLTTSTAQDPPHSGGDSSQRPQRNPCSHHRREIHALKKKVSALQQANQQYSRQMHSLQHQLQEEEAAGHTFKDECNRLRRQLHTLEHPPPSSARPPRRRAPASNTAQQRFQPPSRVSSRTPLPASLFQDMPRRPTTAPRLRARADPEAAGVDGEGAVNNRGSGPRSNDASDGVHGEVSSDGDVTDGLSGGDESGENPMDLSVSGVPASLHQRSEPQPDTQPSPVATRQTPTSVNRQTPTVNRHGVPIPAWANLHVTAEQTSPARAVIAELLRKMT